MSSSCSWRDRIRNDIRARNKLQTLPFVTIYQDYSFIQLENLILISRLIDAERNILELQNEFSALFSESLAGFSTYSDKLRVIHEHISKRHVSEDACMLDKFQRRLCQVESELHIAQEDLKFAKVELSISYDKFSKYDYDIARYRADVDKVCSENEMLKTLLRSHSIQY